MISDFILHTFNIQLNSNSQTWKLDYIIPKVYQPIALFNILKKALKFILAKKVIYLVENYKLLAYNHFDTRQARSTEYALHSIVECIYSV